MCVSEFDQEDGRGLGCRVQYCSNVCMHVCVCACVCVCVCVRVWVDERVGVRLCLSPFDQKDGRGLGCHVQH